MKGFVLEGRRDDVALGWVFSSLTADSFSWRAEEIEPGASAPRVRQRFRPRRQTSSTCQPRLDRLR
jgi:hypothetical protein